MIWRIKLSDIIIGALIGALTTIIGTPFFEKHKSKLELKKIEKQAKNDCLNDVYKNLISIANLYPNTSPNDVMKWLDDSPNFSGDFLSTLKSLGYKKEFLERRLNHVDNDYTIKEQISNIEFAVDRIINIRDKYFIAKEKYELFCETEKVNIDLYAGQEVRNCLVEFEVLLHNTFKVGRCVGESDDFLNNYIEISKRNLINAIRNDIAYI